MGEPRGLSCLLRSILGGRHAGAVFELFGEATGIDEAGFAGDLGGGEAGFVEEAHGGEDSGLDEELLGADAEGGLEAALQVAKSESAGFRHELEGDVLGIVAADGIHGTGDGLHQRQLHLVLGGSTQDAHDADGALAGVEQRELGHDEPVGQALAVKP